ncbi:hypothetical protein RE9431_26240 [Prescottella equi]|nr:hypothetical protein RE9431_26240 [Prescottella equi]
MWVGSGVVALAKASHAATPHALKEAYDVRSPVLGTPRAGGGRCGQHDRLAGGVVMAPLGGILVPEWLYDVLYQLWLQGIPPH